MEGRKPLREVLPGVSSYCFLILWSQNTQFCSPRTDESPTDFNGKFACIRDKRVGPKLCTMMQSDPPAVEIDVIAFSPSPLCHPFSLPTPGDSWGASHQPEGRMQLCAETAEERRRPASKIYGGLYPRCNPRKQLRTRTWLPWKMQSPAFAKRGVFLVFSCDIHDTSSSCV